VKNSRSKVLMLGATVVFGIALMFSFGGSVSAKSQSSIQGHKIGFLIPAYWDFFDGLNHVVKEGIPVIAIINLNSGPGSAPVSYINSEIENFTKIGGRVVGYVPSDYGHLALGTAETQIRDYLKWYPTIAGVFLDNASSSASVAVSKYYSRIYDFTKQLRKRALVVLNTDVWPSRKYISWKGKNTSSIVVVSENSASASLIHVKKSDVPAWAADYGTSRFGVIVHGALVSQLPILIKGFAKKQHAGWIYITDLHEPDPYTSLPSFWNKEVAIVNKVNHA